VKTTGARYFLNAFLKKGVLGVLFSIKQMSVIEDKWK
jgi:hypothetical protein